MKKRYIKLTTLEIEQLDVIKTNGSSNRERNRAHGMLLSNKGYDTKQLCGIFDINMVTILNWMNRWELEGVGGLCDKYKTGRPKVLTETEEKK